MNLQPNKKQRWLILFNVALSVFMATLDGSIVNIALPVMSDELLANINSIQWVVTSYLLTISVLLLIWGKLSDLYGRRMIFTAGFIIFTLGSYLCGISWSLDMLVFSRVVQAVGASAMMALSQSIITSTFPPEERGKALGVNAMAVALGSLVGPTLGGILVHAWGWKSIFLINLPIGIPGALLAYVTIPRIRKKAGYAGFDYKGAILFMTIVILLFLGLLLVQDGNVSILVFLVMVVSALVLLIVFIRHEWRLDSPLLNLNIFRKPIFTLGIISAFLSYASLHASILFLPFYLQQVIRLDILSAGLLMSCYPLATAITAPFSGWLSDRVSFRPLTLTGLMINTICLLLISSLGTSLNMMAFIFIMSILGVGTALFQSPNNSSIMGSVSKEQLGIAGGINALFRNLGMVSGITLSMGLFTIFSKFNINQISEDTAAFDVQLFMKGFRSVFIAAALACFAGFLVSLTRAVGMKKT